MMQQWSDRRAAHDDDRVVADYMARLAGSVPDDVGRLPDGSMLWVKAQILRRWDAERKAHAPLDVMEPVQIAAGLAAAATLLVWSLPSLRQAFDLFGG